MPSAQVRNASMQQLNSADLLDVEDRNWGAEWYDSIGGQATIGAVAVNLDAERHNSAPEIFDFSSDILTVLEAGLYQFNFCVAADKAGSTEGSFYAFLQEDPDTGIFADIPATTAYATVFSAPGSVSNSLVILAGINYRYRLMFATHGVTFTTIQDGSNLSVVRLFKNG